MSTLYRAKHILLEDEDDLEYIMDLINSGSDFGELAREYSECDSAKDGGDLGKFSSGVMDAEFERALYNMKIGEIKGGVRTKYGVHIVYRLDPDA